MVDGTDAKVGLRDSKRTLNVPELAVVRHHLRRIEQCVRQIAFKTIPTFVLSHFRFVNGHRHLATQGQEFGVPAVGEMLFRQCPILHLGLELLQPSLTVVGVFGRRRR